MIAGVHLTKLAIIQGQHGAVLHMLRSSDEYFAGFGEVYFSTIAVGQRKDWRRHHAATTQLAVPHGRVHFALYDDRSCSSSNGATWDTTLGRDNYQLLTIPPGIWFAFHNVGPSDALITNCSSIPHDPTKVDRQEISTSSIPYVWRD